MNSGIAKKVFTLVLALASGLLTTTALAQWQWLDKDGRKVFSDRSPPSDIQDKDIIKRPTGAVRAALPSDATAGPEAKPASAPLVKASAPKLSGKDAELEAKKKKAEDDEIAKKKLEEEKVVRAKTENCERAKSSLATLQSGIRIAATNVKGEQEIYDEAKRQAETKRAQDMIESNCK